MKDWGRTLGHKKDYSSAVEPNTESMITILLTVLCSISFPGVRNYALGDI